MAPLFAKANVRAKAPVLLIIGVHRDELAFGDAVAERLEPHRIAVLRIPKGLTGGRPGPEGLDHYRRRHRDLYGQILQHVCPGHRLLIDLHTGLDEARCSADVLCADTALLRCIDRHAATGDVAGPVRTVRLIGDEASTKVLRRPQPPTTASLSEPGHWPAIRPEIPAAVWLSREPLYVGLEVYLPASGDLRPQPADLAADVIRLLSACRLDMPDDRINE